MMQVDGRTRLIKWGAAAMVVGIALWGVTAMNDDSERVVFSAKDQEKWATRITRYAREGNLDEAMRLLETGQTQQALSEYDAKLLHSQLLIEHSQLEKAETVLRGLIAAYPDQPAAYNDLAIALSRQGKQQEALDALNSAMRTHEAYQQIYNNIKSLTAGLASTSYMKALNLGGDAPKIEMAYLLGNDRSVELQESSAGWPAVQQTKPQPTELAEVMADAVATEQPSESQTLMAALNDAKLEVPAAGNPVSEVAKDVSAEAPEETPAVAVAAVPETQDAEDSVAVAEQAQPSDAGQDVAAFLKSLTVTTDPVTEQAMATLTPSPVLVAKEDEPAPKAPLVKDEEDVEAHVQKWASAWANKDVKGYLTSYIADYSAQYRNHQQWARERTARIKRAKEISIELSDLVVNVATPNSASVTFTQAYRAHNYSDVTKKAMNLIKTEQGWQIAEELSL